MDFDFQNIPTVNIPISKLEENKGQIEGVPRNPRVVKDANIKKLVKSIQEDTEFLSLNCLHVFQQGKKYVVCNGNMRLKACRELGLKVVPCKVIPPDTSTEKLKRYIMKDNIDAGEWDWDAIHEEWDAAQLDDWGVDVPEWGTNGEDEDIERKRREFEERMASGELDEDDPEYQEFLAKFKPKKTTDDCYTPDVVYNAVARWVCDEYGVSRKDFERPFYPGGNYQKHIYPKGCIVVDNPPFSILAEILTFYKERGVKFFLFAPTLTLPSSSCTALPTGVSITYDNGANVNTSFLTNLEPSNIRLRSVPSLYRLLKEANDKNLEGMRKSLPKYVYPGNVVTSTGIGYLSKYGQEFTLTVEESESIRALDEQKKEGKAIYGGGFLISEKAATEKAAAEKAAAVRWKLSEREKAIIERLTKESEARP